MQIPPIQDPVTFGVYKGSKPTSYGQYVWGEYKGYKIEVYDAFKVQQKLLYVSDKFKRFIKSKLIYIENGTKKITRSERK